MTDGLRTFDGGVAIVTGAASGIGRAISQALAQRGCQVVLADIDLGDAEAAAAQIREKGGRASAKHLDVRDFAAVIELVTERIEKLGRIDYIFNNAGIVVAGEVANYTIDAWHPDHCGEPGWRGQRCAGRLRCHDSARVRPHRQYGIRRRVGGILERPYERMAETRKVHEQGAAPS